MSQSARNQPDLLHGTIKEMDDMSKTPNYSTAKMNTYIVLTVLAMLPSAAMGINFITLLVKDIFYHLSYEDFNATIRNGTIWSGIGGVTAWLIPLLLGCIAANVLLQRRKTFYGFILGFILISVSYFLLSMQVGRNITECITNPQPYCEFARFGYLIYFGVSAANVAALIGFVVLANQMQLKRDANLQLAGR